MVGPQKVKPAAFSSFDIAFETAVSVGTSSWVRKAFCSDAAVEMLPEEIGEGLALADGEIGARALDRALDLAAMADDAGVSQQPLHVGLA